MRRVVGVVGVTLVSRWRRVARAGVALTAVTARCCAKGQVLAASFAAMHGDDRTAMGDAGKGQRPDNLRKADVLLNRGHGKS